MREILFKAKRKDNGEWVEGNLVTGIFFKLGQPIPYILSVENVDYDCFEDLTDDYGYYEVVPETLCQYTGLTDKNRNKIWENDICNCEKRGYAFYNCVVKWNSVNARFDVNAMECNFPMTLDECTDDISIGGLDYEVIGNIFDNPELL